MGVGEVEDDRSRLPLLPLPFPRLPPPLCDRLKVLVEGDLEVDRRRLGDPRPALRLEVAVARPLDRDLDRGRTALVSDEDLDLDTVVGPTALTRECDRERDLVRCRDLDRLCSFCGLVLLDGRLPYLRPLVSVCCGCFAVDRCCLDVESAAVVGVLAAVSVSACPGGDPGGVELVTGANTVSLLIFTSHSPVVLYLRASSANTT